MVPPDSGVVDVGTDHATVPIQLARINPNRKIIGVEYNLRPYHQAVQKIVNAGLELVVEIRKGYGLDCVEPGEVEVAIIAGLGSATTAEILRKGKRVVQGLSRLVLGPMDYAYKLRQYLLLNNYSIQRELLVHEFRWYEIIQAHPGDLESALVRPYPSLSSLQAGMQRLFAREFDYHRYLPLQTMLELVPLLGEDPEKASGFLEDKKNNLNRILQNIPEVESTRIRRRELRSKLETLWELKEKLCGLKMS